jgi:hypothetical protein
MGNAKSNEIKNSDWLAINGKQILRFYATTPEGEVCIDSSKIRSSLILRSENLGDRIEIWVSVLINGEENARYNIRMIDTIIWAKE